MRSTGSRSSMSTACGWMQPMPSSTTARSTYSRSLPSGFAAARRPIHLLLENEENQAGRLARHRDGLPRWYTAQWNDDVHHGLHVAASGEAQGYYADYSGDTEKLGRALAEGFAFQGEVMPYR